MDYKVRESEFFYNKIAAKDVKYSELGYYSSAFAASSRSITFAMQAVMSKIEGFDCWYERRQDRLKNDPIAVFFKDYRTISQHIGENPVEGGFCCSGDRAWYYRPCFEIKEVPTISVVEACRSYLKLLCTIVYECYRDFGTIINNQWSKALYQRKLPSIKFEY